MRLLVLTVLMLLSVTAAQAGTASLTPSERKQVDEIGAVIRLREDGLVYLKAIAKIEKSELIVLGQIGRSVLEDGLRPQPHDGELPMVSWNVRVEDCKENDRDCRRLTDKNGYFKFMPNHVPKLCAARLYAGRPGGDYISTLVHIEKCR